MVEMCCYGREIKQYLFWILLAWREGCLQRQSGKVESGVGQGGSVGDWERNVDGK